jgi:transcriptional regulator with XRE-family HTH domain
VHQVISQIIYKSRKIIEVDKNFQNRLAAVFDESRLTQQEAARLLQTGQSTISQWLSGASTPRPKTLLKIAAALKVCPIWLTEGKGEKTPAINCPQEPEVREETKDLAAPTNQVLEDLLPLLGYETTRVLLDRMFEKAKSDHAYFLRNGEMLRSLVNYCKSVEPTQ